MNSRFSSLVSLLVLLLSFATFAGGGYVGNGGGLVEQNFNYAYTALPKLIDTTLTHKRETLDSAAIGLLNRIKSVARQNSSRPDRLVFLSEKEFPGLFKTGENEHHRLAVTGNSTTDSIYINLDLLYTQDGQPAVDLGLSIAILVHEIGHQLGFSDHQALDILGSHVRASFQSQVKSFQMPFQNSAFEFVILNHSGSPHSADLLFRDQKEQVNLNAIVVHALEETSAQKQHMGLSGFQLMNGNYKLELYPNRLVFQVWVNARYITASGYESELFSIELEVLPNGSIQILKTH